MEIDENIINKMVEQRVNIAIENYLNKINVKQLIDMFNEERAEFLIHNVIKKMTNNGTIKDFTEVKFVTSKSRYKVLKTIKQFGVIEFKQLKESCGISHGTFIKAFESLISNDVIIKTPNFKKTYQLNPKIISDIDLFLSNYELKHSIN